MGRGGHENSDRLVWRSISGAHTHDAPCSRRSSHTASASSSWSTVYVAGYVDVAKVPPVVAAQQKLHIMLRHPLPGLFADGDDVEIRGRQRVDRVRTLAQAEIDQLDVRHAARSLVHERDHVVELDVAVDAPDRVHASQALGDAGDHRRVQPRRPRYQLLHRLRLVAARLRCGHLHAYLRVLTLDRLARVQAARGRHAAVQLQVHAFLDKLCIPCLEHLQHQVRRDPEFTSIMDRHHDVPRTPRSALTELYLQNNGRGQNRGEGCHGVAVARGSVVRAWAGLIRATRGRRRRGGGGGAWRRHPSSSRPDAHRHPIRAARSIRCPQLRAVGAVGVCIRLLRAAIMRH
eukprot:2919126-Pleurochrysis_carterae.AAC.1